MYTLLKIKNPQFQSLSSKTAHTFMGNTAYKVQTGGSKKPYKFIHFCNKKVHWTFNNQAHPVDKFRSEEKPCYIALTSQNLSLLSHVTAKDLGSIAHVCGCLCIVMSNKFPATYSSKLLQSCNMIPMVLPIAPILLCLSGMQIKLVFEYVAEVTIQTCSKDHLHFCHLESANLLSANT